MASHFEERENERTTRFNSSVKIRIGAEAGINFGSAGILSAPCERDGRINLKHSTLTFSTDACAKGRRAKGAYAREGIVSYFGLSLKERKGE